MTNLKDLQTTISNIINDSEFRAMVVENIKNEIPANIWNSDSKLQAAIYHKFASELALRLA